MERFCWNCGKTFADDRIFCERDGARIVARDGLAGRIVGKRYALKGLIGEGGMGQVYVGVDQEGFPEEGLAPGTAVAVKLILRGARSAVDWNKAKHSQIRETEVARRIRHDGLLRIYDSGEDRGTDSLFIVSALGGRDLKNILADEGPGSPNYAPSWWLRRVVAIATQVCDALGALHANNIFHRDVKPQNIMEVVGGRIVLIDYGIAKDLHSETHSSTGMIKGTPEYVAPDWFQEGEVQFARADQYSLGITLYELLAGNLPFSAPPGPHWQSAITHQHIHKAPPPIRARRPEIPEALEAVVLRMLEKSSDKRLSDIAKVREALLALSSAAAEPGKPGKPGEPEAAIEISGVQVQVDPESGRPRYVLRF